MIRILLAEDETLLRRHLARTLERAGFAVTVVESATAALEKLEIDHFDLLLIELVLQSADGVDLARRAVETQQGMRVIFITGFAAVLMQDPALEGGLFSPPFHLRDLVSRLTLMFQRGNAADL